MNPKSAPTRARFRPGQFLFKEGDHPRCMYLIKKGTVSVRKLKIGGYIEIGRVFEGEVLGELSFFDRRTRSAAAVALSDVEALELSFEALDKVYKKVPSYIKAIMICVADRLRKADDMIRHLQKKTVAEDKSSNVPASPSGNKGDDDD